RIMGEHPLSKAVRRLRETLVPEASEEDFRLLDRFRHDGDAEAFEILLERHGPMVWRTCRRLVPQTADAEDVFQATFLVLCRKARTLRRRDSLGGWLHRVAYRIALRLNAKPRTQSLDEAGIVSQVNDPATPVVYADLRQFLDETLEQLPD